MHIHSNKGSLATSKGGHFVLYLFSFGGHMDFSKAYRGVQYFGVWADDTADAYGMRDAMAILASAAERTQDEDLRHDRPTLEALDYLVELVDRLPAATAFRAALAEPHPVTRRRAVTDAYRALCRALQFSGR